jgi:hypothetical protein
MATLFDVYASLFPGSPTADDPFEQVPLMPTDVFAFVAHLLERSGAYHHIAPDVSGDSDISFRRIVVDERMRTDSILIGRKWRETPLEPGRRLPEVPLEVDRLWKSLSRFARATVFVHLDDEADAPLWWTICLELVMICDEACQDIGFDPDNPFFNLVMDEYEGQALTMRNVFNRVQHGPFSLSVAAEDLVCVQAKSRTPSVGCTLRSLTHHLALLPPRGQVRARWVAPVFAEKNDQSHEKLGLLLVPFPYRVADGAFHDAGIDQSGHWGWFGLEQKWLPLNKDRRKREAFVEYIESLIAAARAKGGRVDGVVLPELALDFPQFRSLATALARDAQIDFLISGISSNRTGRKGNFVAIMPFFLLGSERDPDITGWQGMMLVREKHHRWKLDQLQIDAYGLTGLSADKSWWEELTILSRSLDLLVYRGNTTLTTLICEDLARVDPCQAVVRGVGPNLLIALLMDGPQLGARWPGRYATVLAEDPGTSVLSFTSFGLIARQNDIGAYDQATSIALWKDEKSGVRTLQLHREADAIVLELRASEKEERTLDGRGDGGASVRWEYEHHISVGIGDAVPGWIRTGVAR